MCFPGNWPQALRLMMQFYKVLFSFFSGWLKTEWLYVIWHRLFSMVIGEIKTLLTGTAGQTLHAKLCQCCLWQHEAALNP